MLNAAVPIQGLQTTFVLERPTLSCAFLVTFDPHVKLGSIFTHWGEFDEARRFTNEEDAEIVARAIAVSSAGAMRARVVPCIGEALP